MGLNKEQLQNRRMKDMLISLANTNLTMLKFNLTLVSNEKDIKITKDLIKQSKKAIKVIESVKHNEILVDLYNSFIVGNMPYFISFVRVVSQPNKIKYWDSTKKGYADFLNERTIALAKSEDEMKAKREEKERLEKARAEGKNVELMYKDGKVKYVIVEEKPN